MEYMYNSTQNFQETESGYLSPLSKWGIDVAKMRRKAFASYAKNYHAAVNQWPEFKQEYDYSLSMKKADKPKQEVKNQLKNFKISFFPGTKNILRYFTLSNSD